MRDLGARRLTAVEFDVVWRAVAAGPPPAVLRLPSPGRTHTERRGIEAHVWAALRDRGLARAGEPEVGVADLVHVLATAPVRLEVRAWGVQEVRATTARRGEGGVCAERRGDDVVLEPCPSIIGAVVEALPGRHPGPGRAASVPAADLDAALCRASGAGLRADLVDRGVDTSEASVLARMLHGIDGRAQIALLVEDRAGMLRRSNLLEVLDAPRGRYLMTRTRGPDGTSWVNVAPVDDRRLRQRLTELVERDSLSPGHRAASAAVPPR